MNLGIEPTVTIGWQESRDALENVWKRLPAIQESCMQLLLDFSLTVKAAPHECVIRTSQPQT